MVLNIDFIKYLYLLMKEDSSYIILSIALFGASSTVVAGCIAN